MGTNPSSPLKDKICTVDNCVDIVDRIKMGMQDNRLWFAYVFRIILDLLRQTIGDITII